MVLDHERSAIQTTNAAIARRLLKDGHAFVYSRDPFIIQLDRATSDKVKLYGFTLSRIISW